MGGGQGGDEEGEAWATYWRMRGAARRSLNSSERTAPPVEVNWDSEDEAEEAGAEKAADEVEEQAE